MRDDLHALLDGEDPGDIERLFESGAFGSDEYREFRQHQRLQKALARNGCAERLTAAESASILDNVRTAVGIPQTTAAIPVPTAPRRGGGWWRTGLALLAGLGIGYGVNELVTQREMVLNTGVKEPQPAVVATPPQVAAPNYDSLVRVIRDSMSEATSTAPVRVEPSGKGVAKPGSTKRKVRRPNRDRFVTGE